MAARLDVKCPAFAPDGAIPEEYTGFGEDLSPEIIIGNIGAGVRSLAVIMDDLNVPVRGELTHWIIWNFPPSSVISKAIPHGARIPSGAVQGPCLWQTLLQRTQNTFLPEKSPQLPFLCLRTRHASGYP